MNNSILSSNMVRKLLATLLLCVGVQNLTASQYGAFVYQCAVAHMSAIHSIAGRLSVKECAQLYIEDANIFNALVRLYALHHQVDSTVVQSIACTGDALRDWACITVKKNSADMAEITFEQVRSDRRCYRLKKIGNLGGFCIQILS